ncbi:LysR substrate-binding domain-containing protein [Mangrovibacter sp. SLW1]
MDNLSRQVRSSPLVNLEYFLAVRPGHILAGQTATVRTLADYPLVDVIFQHKIAVLAQEVYGEVISRMKTILKTSSTNTAIHLIKESDAITLLPLTTIKKWGWRVS